MAWYNDFPIHHGYITEYRGPNTDTPHYADDVETSFHTPITSLFEGDVVKADYQPWGGEVFIRTNVPGIGPTEEYFYHLDDIDPQIHKGYHIKRGEEIGLSGGQHGYGDHPTDPHWSTGPHTHVGFFSKFVPAVGGGSIPYGPDITPYVKSGGGPSKGCAQPADQSKACNFWDLANFDPRQCTALGGDPCALAMGDTGPAGAGKQAGQTVDTWVRDNLTSTLGIESSRDLLYRAGFIGAGILFIIFGLMIFAKGFSPQVTLGA